MDSKPPCTINADAAVSLHRKRLEAATDLAIAAARTYAQDPSPANFLLATMASAAMMRRHSELVRVHSERMRRQPH